MRDIRSDIVNQSSELSWRRVTLLALCKIAMVDVLFVGRLTSLEIERQGFTDCFCSWKITNRYNNRAKSNSIRGTFRNVRGKTGKCDGSLWVRRMETKNLKTRFLFVSHVRCTTCFTNNFGRQVLNHVRKFPQDTDININIFLIREGSDNLFHDVAGKFLRCERSSKRIVRD